MGIDTDKVRELNDAFRTSFVGGKVLATPGITAQADLEIILRKVQSFDSFCEDNNPHHENDFGSFFHNGKQIFWKVDYYNVELSAGSPDPSDPSVTTRTLTVTLRRVTN